MGRRIELRGRPKRTFMGVEKEDIKLVSSKKRV